MCTVCIAYCSFRTPLTVRPVGFVGVAPKVAMNNFVPTHVRAPVPSAISAVFEGHEPKPAITVEIVPNEHRVISTPAWELVHAQQLNIQ